MKSHPETAIKVPLASEPLVSLADFNARRRREIAASEERRTGGHPNGIACPDCGEELRDSSPHQWLTSIPPQTYVHCANPGCGYTGTRVV